MEYFVIEWTNILVVELGDRLPHILISGERIRRAVVSQWANGSSALGASVFLSVATPVFLTKGWSHVDVRLLPNDVSDSSAGDATTIGRPLYGGL